MLAPLGAVPAARRQSSITSRGTGRSEKSRTVRRRSHVGVELGRSARHLLHGVLTVGRIRAETSDATSHISLGG